MVQLCTVSGEFLANDSVVTVFSEFLESVLIVYTVWGVIHMCRLPGEFLDIDSVFVL